MKHWPILLVLLVYLLTHVWQLGNIPYGLSNDESATGYEAYSLLKTGKDQWGKSWPITYFRGFGDYRLPFYIYLTIPFVAIFGLEDFSVRLPAVLMGGLTLLAIYFFVKKHLGESTAIWTVALLALTPWYFGLTRVAIESPVALGLIVAGIWFLEMGKRGSGYYGGGIILWWLSLTTYPASRVFVPLLFLFVIYLNKDGLKNRIELFLKDNASRTLVALLIMLCLAWLAVTSFKQGGAARLTQTGFFRNAVIIDQANEHLRGCTVAFWTDICRLMNNKLVFWGLELARNYLNHFSLDFLFINQKMAEGYVPHGGLLLMSELPMLAYGLYYLTKNKRKFSLFVIGWFLVSPLADSLTGEGHYSRAFLMVFPLVVTAGLGMSIILRKNRILGLAIVAIWSLESSRFLMDYFGYFARYQSRFSQSEYRQVMEYIGDIDRDDYKNVYISNHFFDTKQYVFYLYYFKVDPRWYQGKNTKDWHTEKDGWIRVSRVGNWYFGDGLPGEEDVPNKSLFIGSQAEEILPKINSRELCTKFRVDLVKQFYFPDGGKAFGVAQSNFQEDLPKECP